MKRMRSYLTTPAHRERMVASAARSEADAIFLDLEDAVPVGMKGEALKGAVACLGQIDFDQKHVSVRINAVSGGLAADELQALGACPRLDAVIVPKAESETEINEVVARLGAARSASAQPVAIELLIETALGLVMVERLAAHPAVGALHLGVGDFAASLGARSAEIGASPEGYRHVSRESGEPVSTPLDFFAYPMMRILVAARAYGRMAIDGPCGAFQDEILSSASASKAAAMGFDGKQVIHPAQIAGANLAFTPGATEQASARALLAALDAAGGDGQGAVTHEGRMIDYANVRMARRILALAGAEDATA